MAHTKAQKTAAGNRDSRSKRLGVKIFGNQTVAKGNIIIRQKGTKFRPGFGARMGRDFTIYAALDGRVMFQKKRAKHYVAVLAQTV